MSHGTETGQGDKVSQVLNLRDYAVLRLFGYTVEVSDVFFCPQITQMDTDVQSVGRKTLPKVIRLYSKECNSFVGKTYIRI